MMQSGRRKRLIHTVILFILAALLLAGGALYQHRHFKNLRAWRPFQEKLYLPEGQKLRLASLGFANLYADILWLRSIQAFGGHWFVVNNDMSPIFHYFDVITDLDPLFFEAYKMGKLVMGDEGGDYPKSLDILRKGMIHNPTNWDIPYLGIYNTVWQMNDYRQARFFARMASRIPGRPDFIARMVEYVERRQGRLEIAYRLNLQYLLQYMDEGKEYEAKLMAKRFIVVLDRWNKEKLIENARHFIKLEGRDPTSLQELVHSPSWVPYKAPTMEHLNEIIQAERAKGGPLAPRLESIYERSFVEIRSEPPEPNGYVYLIVPEFIPGAAESEETSGTIVATRENADSLPESHFGYILNAADIVDILRNYVSSMNMQLASFLTANNRYANSMEELIFWIKNKRLPATPEENTEGFNYHDPLGGEFIYDPESRMLHSTTVENPPRLREPIDFY